MPQDNKKILYQTLSKEYDLGTFDEFAYRLRDPANRKALYDSISPTYDVGDFSAFESKLAIEPEPVFTPPKVDDGLRGRVFEKTLQETATRPFSALAEAVLPEAVSKFPLVEGATKALDLPTRTMVGGMSEGGAELERAVDAVKKGNYAEAAIRAPLAVLKAGLGAAVSTTPVGLGFVAGQEVATEVSPEAGEVIEKGLSPVTAFTQPKEGLTKPLAELGDIAFQFLAFGLGHKGASRLRQRIAEGKKISPAEQKAVQEAIKIAETEPSLVAPEVKEAVKKASEGLPAVEEVGKQKVSEEPISILPQGMKNGIIRRLGGKDAETKFGKAGDLPDSRLIELAKEMPPEESATTQAAKRGSKLDLAGAYLKWDEYKKTEKVAKTYEEAFKGQLLREEVEGFIAKQEGREHKAMFPKDIEAKLQELSGKKPEPKKKYVAEEVTSPTGAEVETFKEKLLKKNKETGQKAFKGSTDIPTELEGGGRPVKASEIIENVSRKLGVPIRIKHFRIGKRLGIFKEKSEVVRLKEANDLATTSHEIAHFIDKSSEVSKNFRDELKKLDYEPKKARASEGFAEFVRHYITMDDAATVAPKFHDFFINDFLPKNPKFAEAIKDMKSSVDAWRKQSALARVLSQIDFDATKTKQTLGERFGEYWLKFRTAFDTDLAPVNHAINEILRGEKVEPRLDPREIATAVAKAAPAKARAFVLDGAFDFQLNKVGKSLKEIVDPVSKDIENAIAYGYARRAVDLHGRDINPGIGLKDAEFVVNKYKSPAFDKFVEEVTEWNGHLLNYLVDAGGLSKEAASAIREANPVYIPLKRAFTEQTLGTGKGKVDLPQPVKRIRGSGREIVNPLESMIQQAEKMIAVADKARVVRALVNLAESKEGTGKWVEKVTAPTNVDRVGLERLKAELDKQGLDLISKSGEKLAPEDLDAIVTLFSQSNRYYGKDNVAAVLKDGKYEFYEFEPNLFRSLKGLDSVTLPWFINATFGRVSRAIRLGATGIRAGFSLITNPIRDAQTFALQTETGAGIPSRVLKGLMHEFARTEERRQFRAAGGEMAQPLGVDRKMVQNLVEEALSNTAKTKTLNVVKHPIEALRKVFSFPEAGPRLAEFEAVMKKWEPQIQEAAQRGDLKRVAELKENAAVEAAAKAAEVTVNFKRMGTYGAVLNQIIPFFNPAVQGVTKTGRTIIQHPVRSGLRATAMLTAPTLALWWINKDEEWYKELPDWQKYGFWNFRVGNEIVRLPKPFEWGYLFAGLPEATANSLYQKDPQSMKDWAGEAGGGLVPPLIPGAVQPAAEVYFNWDIFRETPIVSPGLEQMLPSEQYLPHTSSLAKEIGGILNVSPAKIDHLLSGYTGGLATDVLNALPKDIKERADMPVVGRLFTRTDAFTMGGKSVQTFYEEAEKAERYYRTINRYLGRSESQPSPTEEQITKAVKLIGFDEEASRYYALQPFYNKGILKLRELRRKQKEIDKMKIDEGLKKMLHKTIGRAAVEVARSVK